MAEYIEVMKQKKRMCHSTLCCKCDIFHLSGEDIGNCPQFILNNPSKAEKIIMSWAAEHPEPVYPTWREWLIKKGLIDFKPDFKSLLYDPSLPLQENQVIECLNVKASEPIPADIAKSLGLEPKEN